MNFIKKHKDTTYIAPLFFAPAQKRKKKIELNDAQPPKVHMPNEALKRILSQS
jgi:hypothetical protein